MSKRGWDILINLSIDPPLPKESLLRAARLGSPRSAKASARVRASGGNGSGKVRAPGRPDLGALPRKNPGEAPKRGSWRFGDLDDARRVARTFGLSQAGETLYRDFRLRIAPGDVLAVTGPSGSGKTALLNAVRGAVPDAVTLDVAALAGDQRPAVECLGGPPEAPKRDPRLNEPIPGRFGDLPDRLNILSRCGLAEAKALVRSACRLSGGQLFRLALAAALWQAIGSGRPRLLLVDEFASTLDEVTAQVLARQMVKLVRRHRLGMLVSTPRQELLEALAPDKVIVKPLGQPPRLICPKRIRTTLPVRRGVPTSRSRTGGLFPHTARKGTGSLWEISRWPIRAGRIADYGALAGFHYLSGPPAAHKRVWTIRVPRRLRGPLSGQPEVAAVLVVSPPVLNCQGRNLATGGRYTGPDPAVANGQLNAEVECISRVVVHPVYRCCGLAVRLVRHALRHACTPLVEALAIMGTMHPFFELAGMTAYRLPPDRHAQRLLSAADAVGLGPDDLAAVQPVRRFLRPCARFPNRDQWRFGASQPADRKHRPGKAPPAVAFFRKELDLFIRRALSPAQRGRAACRLSDPLGAPRRNLWRFGDLLEQACRRATLVPVYYLARRTRGARRDRSRLKISRKRSSQ